MPTFADEVVETSQTMGTGTYDLDGVRKSGYRLFPEAYGSGAKLCFVVRNKGNTKWEINRLGTLTHGTPVRLSRAVVLSTNGNAAVPWTNDDIALTIYVAPLAEVLELVLAGNAGTTRNPMLQGFALWPNTTAGASGRVPFTINPTGSAEKEVGAWEGTKSLFVANAPAPVRDVGAANSTIAATDRGWIVSHNTAAAVRTAGLPTAASLGEGFYAGVYADGALPVILQTTGGEAIDDCVVLPGQVTWLRSTGTKWVAQRGGSPTRRTRQTVWSGSRDANGLPNILPSSAGGLTLTAQNVSASLPLLVSAAGGLVDRNGYRLTAPSWAGLTNSATNFLYLVVGADGLHGGGERHRLPGLRDVHVEVELRGLAGVEAPHRAGDAQARARTPVRHRADGAEHLRRHLADAGIPVERVRRLWLHQANLNMNRTIARQAQAKAGLRRAGVDQLHAAAVLLSDEAMITATPITCHQTETLLTLATRGEEKMLIIECRKRMITNSRKVSARACSASARSSATSSTRAPAA